MAKKKAAAAEAIRETIKPGEMRMLSAEESVTLQSGILDCCVVHHIPHAAADIALKYCGDNISTDPVRQRAEDLLRAYFDQFLPKAEPASEA